MNRLSRRGFLKLTALAAACCGCADVTGETRALAWGGPGRRPGEFIRPRAIGVHKGEVYVVDTTGRLQVFTPEGDFLRMWSLPDWENGTPTAVSFASDDRVLLADTHYSRILEYSVDGDLLVSWGGYGEGPDRFVYPTDVEIGPAGEYVVSEYGMGAERVHVFAADRTFLREWGGHGDAPGEFNRAMALALTPDSRALVCDTGNHRVQIFSLEGEHIGMLGDPNAEPGGLRFPYDVSASIEGDIVVCEYGANRLSLFNQDGAFVRHLGGPGRGPGQFSGPRGATVDVSGTLYVADTGNDRIQVIRSEAAA